jgi:hypothetical protein
MSDSQDPNLVAVAVIIWIVAIVMAVVCWIYR